LEKNCYFSGGFVQGAEGDYVRILSRCMAKTIFVFKVPLFNVNESKLASVPPEDKKKVQNCVFSQKYITFP